MIAQERSDDCHDIVSCRSKLPPVEVLASIGDAGRLPVQTSVIGEQKK